MANARPILILFTKSFSRFGLRTLLVAVAGCAILLGYWNWKYAPVARAVKRLANEEFFVEYDPEVTVALSTFESWIHRLSGISTAPSSVTQIIGYTNGGLEGLECFPNLRFVDLQGPNISDLDPLSNLKSLESLDLVSDQIVDLSPLGKLTGLRDVLISSRGLVDISPLSRCENLETLELANSRVSDISALNGLPMLTHVNLSQTPVKDIQVLASLTNLTTVNLSNTEVESLRPLEHLTGIYQLSIDGSPLKSLRGVENLVQLSELDLSDTLISDLQPLEGLKNLSTLRLINTRLENLETLPLLPEIAWLEVAGQDFKSLAGLARAMPRDFQIANTVGNGNVDEPRNGIDISLHDCPVNDLYELGEIELLVGFALRSIPASQLPDFQSQFISTASVVEVPIADFSPLENQPLTRLTIESPSAHFGSGFITRLKCFDDLHHLTIKDASIGNLSILSSMQSLLELNLTNCDLSNFEALSKLTELRDLTLNDTELSDIDWMRDIPLLTGLSIANTRVSDLSPMAELTSLNTLNLNGCPVSDLRALNPTITDLRLDRTYIRDLNFLRKFDSLDRLQICDTNVSDLWPLIETQQPSQLLKIAGVCLEDPSSIEKLIWLEALDISGTNITNAKAFENFSGLSYLVVEDVEIDLAGLKKNLPQCEILLKRTEDDWYPFSWVWGCCF